MSEKLSFAFFKLRRMFTIVFICCLTIVLFISFDIMMAKVRDIKRRVDAKTLVKALDLYHDEYGSYPVSINDWRGWDLTCKLEGGEAGFLKMLKDNKLIDKMVSDPINDATYYYQYQKYAAGDYGCANSFYILQIINFELPTTDNGAGSCSGLNWVDLAPNGWTAQGFD
ncbi:MAG: hypothetical protein U9R14_04270 [Patescibacteria group bacterium]|nr:hypothetical protein [Patescibacteria group bacterium]